MADLKITALTANTTPLLTDILPMVDDPIGTPLTQKITFSDAGSVFANPPSNDGRALGTTVLQWSDLFLASGGVINHNNGSCTVTGGTNIWTFGGSGANGNGIVLPAGGTSIAPLVLTPGTNLTTPTDGAIEMDGDCLYACTDAGNRGVVAVRHIIRADSTRTFASNTAQQAIFSTPTNGTLTLETGCYTFKALVSMDTMSSTTGNGKFSLIGAGGATLGSILWFSSALDGALDTLIVTSSLIEAVATQTAANIATSQIATVVGFVIDGTFEVTVAGTIIPSFAQTTANAAVVKVGSYFMCERIGSTSMTSVGQWT